MVYRLWKLYRRTGYLQCETYLGVLGWVAFIAYLEQGSDLKFWLEYEKANSEERDNE